MKLKKEFFTPLQIADMLQVREQDVLLWLEQKELGGIKIGTIWRVREDQFDAFIAINATNLPMPAEEEVVVEEPYDETFLSLERSRRNTRKKGTQRYSKLRDFLVRRNTSKIRLTFAEIEKTLGRELPNSAREHRAYWANDPKHSQAKAWLDAGWRAEELDLVKQEVSFVRKK